MLGIHRHVLPLILATLTLAAFTNPAPAQDDDPNKTIHLIVASAAGGPSDLPARLASPILSARFAQPVVVENRAGAGGALGARSNTPNRRT